MPHKTALEVTGVWVATIIANVINVTTDILPYLPIIKDAIAIISLALAIAYTLYKFFGDWKGFNPRKKNEKI